MAKPLSDTSGTQTASEAGAPPRRNRATGHVISCDGTEARVACTAGHANAESADYWAVGQLVSIQVPPNRVVGLLHRIETPNERWNPAEANSIILAVDLIGEMRLQSAGGLRFSSGISKYPHVGAPVHRIRNADLAAIYTATDETAVRIGCLSQNGDMPAQVSVRELVSRHFAVVGTTGTGKSTALALVLKKIVERLPDQRVLILDPHNEFTHAFGDLAVNIEARDLNLPFWLLTFEEMVNVIFQGRVPASEELDAFRELIPQAKAMYTGASVRAVRRGGGGAARLSADTPVPYRIDDTISLLDQQIGALENERLRPHLRDLSVRIKSIITDPRFAFLFNNRQVSDSILEAVGQIYRVPMEGRPITVFQLSGIPSEVVNSVVSVLCRLAFDLALASQSRLQTLVVCEEAHRYIPAESDSGFNPTRAAIARIAKEGRKYGVSLGIVTQRPHELDPTILSQCNSIFALRLGNEADQEVMRRAISNASKSAVNFLSSLGDQEAIAFGRAVSTPMRLFFDHVETSAQPRSQHVQDHTGCGRDLDFIDLQDAIDAMRGAKANDAPPPADADSAGPDATSVMKASADQAAIAPVRESRRTSAAKFGKPTLRQAHSN